MISLASTASMFYTFTIIDFLLRSYHTFPYSKWLGARAIAYRDCRDSNSLIQGPCLP